MGPLLLLTSTLLSVYFHPGRATNQLPSFTIKDVNLLIEPETDVIRGTNVTLRCQATVSSFGQEALSRVYTIFKDNQEIHSETSNTSEDVLYQLPETRVSNTGKYGCAVNIKGNRMTSKKVKFTVTGLSKPVLHINKGVVSEGEKLTATCTAPDETGSIFFYFYLDSKEIHETQVNSNQAVVDLQLSSGIHKVYCDYIVFIGPFSLRSMESSNVTIKVKELPITAILEISPQGNIYEGDRLDISCTVLTNSSQSMYLSLSQGTKLLYFGNSSANTRANYSMVAQAKGPEELECRLESGNLKRVTKKTLKVTEVFSEPALTMSPAEVFRNEDMTLTCKSIIYISGRLTSKELTYTLDPKSSLRHMGSGVFFGRALQNDFNYTCVAEAMGVKKYSKTLTVRPKVSVSTPRISAIERVILGKSFKILCESDNGSLPVTYTLLKDRRELGTVTVKHPNQQAIFSTTITETDEIKELRCRAKNNNKNPLESRELNTAVIVPLKHLTVTVLPEISQIYEGQEDFYIICGVNGTVPVTFKFYREGTARPLDVIPTNKNQANYRIPVLFRNHTGNYFCEASNYANNIKSEVVHIEVRLALWKKAVIGGFSVLVVLVLAVIGCVLYFRSKRGKREPPVELSVKPSSPKSDDSLAGNLTHDKEFYNADTVRVDSAVVSVWSKRPPEDDEANEQESSTLTNEPDVEYTEVVHPLPVDPARVPLRKGTDTVYSELQNSPHGAVNHHDYGSVEYAELHGEQTEINNYHPEVNNYQDLPEPVD